MNISLLLWRGLHNQRGTTRARTAGVCRECCTGLCEPPGSADAHEPVEARGGGCAESQVADEGRQDGLGEEDHRRGPQSGSRDDSQTSTCWQTRRRSRHQPLRPGPVAEHSVGQRRRLLDFVLPVQPGRARKAPATRTRVAGWHSRLPSDLPGAHRACPMHSGLRSERPTVPPWISHRGPKEALRPRCRGRGCQPGRAYSLAWDVSTRAAVARKVALHRQRDTCLAMRTRRCVVTSVPRPPAHTALVV